MAGQPEITHRKAHFGDIYTAPDPRPYYRTLWPLEYQIPQNALPAFEAVLAEMATLRPGAEQAPVVDLCCSYAPNSTLLGHDLDLTTIAERYTSHELAELDTEQLLASDRAFYTEHVRRQGQRVLGLDVSEPAIEYAVAAGLLSQGWAENLEEDEPSASLREGLRDFGLLICTGGVGYVTHRTFQRVLACHDHPGSVWAALFVLRAFPVDDIAASLNHYGLTVTHRSDVSVRQRRFASRDEQEAALADVRARGLDPAGKEADGWYYADLYVARPGGT